ncbi:MAG: hypothetical protein NTW16_02885, partial [Bacteroidetes bacterium]|nr:hypothetical protein [Bacteroidota bacterium]
MKKRYSVFMVLLLIAMSSMAQSLVNCDFTVAVKACVNQEVKVTYTGDASANATYLWSFDDAQILSGTGQGPFFVKWDSAGEKHVILSIN